MTRTRLNFVVQVSKPAGRNPVMPAWKPAAQQVWKPALRKKRSQAPLGQPNDNKAPQGSLARRPPKASFILTFLASRFIVLAR
jgi:hypothetical protein